MATNYDLRSYTAESGTHHILSLYIQTLHIIQLANSSSSLLPSKSSDVFTRPCCLYGFLW